MTFDPRTVSLRFLLERADFRRPDLSIVLPAAQAGPAELKQLAAFADEYELSIQIVLFEGSQGRGQGARPVADTDSAGHSSLALLSVAPRPQEPIVESLNRAVSAAIGEVILLGEASPAALLALMERFGADADLGAFRVGPVRRREARAEQRPPRTLLSSGFAIRGDLWMALGGLDETFRSPDWAMRDFCLRARAIGFATPKRIYPFDHDVPDAAVEGDRRLYRSHTRIAPDRSREWKQRSSISVEPDQVTVFTAITGCYDTLKPQPHGTTGGAPLVAFLDKPTSALHESRMRGWQLARADFPSIDDRRASRYYKVNAHLALPESPYSLWIDASVSLAAPYPVTRLAERFLAECDICVFRHSTRRSIYDEAEACKARGLDRAKTVDSQIGRYRQEGLPGNSGLAELPVILRRHSVAVRAFNEAWWAEILAGSWRDQLSFNYVVWKTGLRYAIFPLSMALQNGLFLKFRRVTARL